MKIVPHMKPIFIGGCDRSGTTLLGSMLGAHSQGLTVPESQFVVQIYQRFAANDLFHAQRTLEQIEHHWRFKLWKLDLNVQSVPENITSYAQLIAWIVKQYGIRTGKNHPSFWVDHTPLNTWCGATLLELFPQAKLIHVVRDGRAVASSLMRLDWGPVTIDKAAHFWVERTSYGLAAEAFWGKERVMRVRYEDIVQEPERCLKSLCAFLEIDYEPHMLTGGGFKVPDYTRQQHALVGKQPTSARINAWERELTSREIEIFESVTWDMLRYMGYTPVYTVKRGMTKWEQFRFGLQDLLQRQLLNKIRQRRRIRASLNSNVNL